MNPPLAVAALVFVVGLMFMLPLIPALVELRRKSDALPLQVVQQNAGEIRHFAIGFREYIKGLEPTMQRCVADGTSATGTLPDGEEYVVLGRIDEPLVLAHLLHANTTPDRSMVESVLRSRSRMFRSSLPVSGSFRHARPKRSFSSSAFSILFIN